MPVDEEADEATPISSMNREMLAKAESLGLLHALLMGRTPGRFLTLHRVHELQIVVIAVSVPAVWTPVSLSASLSCG